jgi:sugar/nucleoside kinase (ribokinase family)
MCRPETGGFFLDVKKFDPLTHMRFEGVIMNPSLILLIPAPVWLFAGLLFLLPPDARAEFYKYKDSGGNLVITNRLEDVPKKYRQRVKVVWDADLEARDPLARRRAEADRLRGQRESLQEKQEQPKTIEKKKANGGKTLVITLDEETGQLIRTLE